MISVSIELIARLLELVSVGILIVCCVLLYRFFRGGIMEQAFQIFAFGSVFFFLGVLMASLIELKVIPSVPYDSIHLVLEIIFVVFLLSGFLILYRRWMAQNQLP